MNNPRAGTLSGSVRWAVVPFAPAPPFRLYAGAGSEPIEVPDAGPLIKAAESGGDAELSYIVPGKARPVLLLNDPPAAQHREVTALRLMRLARLSPDEQQRVRAHEDELLFHLAPDRFDLPEENAAMVSALVRLHVDAIGDGPPLGRLDDTEARRARRAHHPLLRLRHTQTGRALHPRSCGAPPGSRVRRIGP